MYILKLWGQNIRSLDPMYPHLWQRVPSWGISIFAYSASGSTSLWSLATGSFLGSDPSYLHPDCSLIVFAFCSIWLVLLLRLSFRLFSTFLLQPGCHASTHWPSHLGPVQTTMSTANTSCHCHCNDYFSDRELQCWLMIIISLPLRHGPTAGVAQQEITGLS